VAYTLDALRACAELEELILIVAPEDVERARRTLLRASGARTEKVVGGGARRQDSVWAGLAEANPAHELVLIHDGARPFVTPDLVTRTVAAAAAHGAAVAALPATDTLKEVDAERWVTGTLDRAHVWQVQTPQAFARELLLEAHRAGGEEAASTDDAALVERLAHPVRVVVGEAGNFKITTPAEAARATALLAGGGEPPGRRMDTRTGIGYDAHRLAAGRKLVLGGVEFAGEEGLVGHSDGDVVCHAICDALLGASVRGDIGQLFPDDDPRLAGVDSLSLLARVAQEVRGERWEIEHVDAVVVAERPRLAPCVSEVRRALAGALEVALPRVSIKGKSTEGMGFTGRGEGIACYAVCTLRRCEGHATRLEARERSC